MKSRLTLPALIVLSTPSLALCGSGGLIQADAGDCLKYRIAVEFIGEGCEPTGGCASPFGMNDHGAVVGHLQCFSDYAFQWSDGVGFELVHPAGAVSSRAKAINRDGVIVGDTIIPEQGDGLRAFVRVGDQLHVLPSPEWALSVDLVAINSVGDAVGSWVNTRVGLKKPFAYLNGEAADLSHEFPIDWAVQFTGINDRGQAVGWMGTHPLDDARAFIRQLNGDRTVLEPAPGALASYGRGISSTGDVAGVSYFDLGGIVPSARAMVWHDGAGHLLAESGAGIHEFAEDLNSEGVVIGNVATASGAFFPVVWFGFDSEVYMLEDLVVEADGASFRSVRHFNESGRILLAGARAELGSCVVFILEPIGPPTPDLTDDGVVDETDLVALLNAWGDGAALTDLTCDGRTGMDDLVIVLSSWGRYE